jgi:hypothetical protein
VQTLIHTNNKEYRALTARTRRSTARGEIEAGEGAEEAGAGDRCRGGQGGRPGWRRRQAERADPRGNDEREAEGAGETHTPADWRGHHRR